MKILSTLMASIFLVSCSDSETEQISVIAEERGREFLGGGSCSEHFLYNEADGLPVAITASVDYFECGDEELETLARIAPGSMPTGSGSITINDKTLSTDSVGVIFYDDSDYENHKGIQLYLHDGQLQVAEKRFELFDETQAGIYRHEVRYGIYSASYVLSVELASVATDVFELGTFEYLGDSENPNSLLYANSNVIFSAISFYDVSGNGIIDSGEEILNITSGHVTISGELPNWTVIVDVQLHNGDILTGQYFGDIMEIPRSEDYAP